MTATTSGRRARTIISSARQAETVQPGKYPTSVQRLYLHVRGGSRAWVLRYTRQGKAKEVALGTLPGISFKRASIKAGEASILLAEGRDPEQAWAAERAETSRVVPTVPTFTQVAAAYIRQHRGGWKNRKHARQWVSTLKTYARPLIGTTRVDEVDTEQVLAILQPIWMSKTETAKRVQGRIENVLDFAAARQWRSPNNPARWRGHLDKLLPKPSRVAPVRQQPALPYPEVAAFVARLHQLSSISARALEFLILTASRTNEVLGAQWQEIDLDNSLWTVPASRMKGRREHRVPLSPAALTLLKELPRLRDHPYVFPGAKANRPLSNMALLQMMRGLGYGVGGDQGDAVPHGFRSSFRDWAGEISSYPNHVCEMALAHAVANKAEAAYRRGDLFEKRRQMMQDWADWCLQPPADQTTSG